MSVAELGTLGNRLAESHTRLASDACDVVFAFHAFNVDFQVKFSHARDNGLYAMINAC